MGTGILYFNLMKRERIKRKIDKDLETARQDVFSYIEMLYNPVCRPGFNDDLSSVDFEKLYAMKV